MADIFVKSLRFLVILLLLALLLQEVDPTPCGEKLVKNTDGGSRDMLKHSPSRRLMLATNQFVVPKHSNGSRTPYNASDHDVPSGANPISNR